MRSHPTRVAGQMEKQMPQPPEGEKLGQGAFCSLLPCALIPRALRDRCTGLRMAPTAPGNRSRRAARGASETSLRLRSRPSSGFIF